ncbi:putative cyclin [Cyclospora cayetanensis]|uniref:Cyclin n=1 Tax=Cyclospora cayetanensis TaxID=88456 RepID=A0A1D3CUT6_9EIME|nr:putative cyclin [Cyclospora cayetanensis]
MATQIVLVPRKLQQQTPSTRDGLSREVEISQRVYGCQLIQKAGVLLRLEAVTVASAQTILHRFYYRKSLKKFDVRLVATSSLLLACKLEEDPRRVKSLIDVVQLLSRAEDANAKVTEDNIDYFLIEYDSTEFDIARAEIFRCERYILRELGFMVSQTLVHPHRYILQYIHALCKGDYVPTNRLSQIAWGYLNDSMQTTLCCEVQPAVVAVGSIFLAACDLNIPLARETGWYELFDVTWEDVVKVCTRILSLYKREPPKYKKLAETRPVVVARPEKSITKNEKDDEATPAGAAPSAAPATEANSKNAVDTETEKMEAEPMEVESTDNPELKVDDKQSETAEGRGAETRPEASPARESPSSVKVPESPRSSAVVSRSHEASTSRREAGEREPPVSRRAAASGSVSLYRPSSEDSRDPRDSRHGYRDSSHRNKPTDSYRNGHRESREEAAHDHSTLRRAESRESPSRYSSSRSMKWERFSSRSRYEGHSIGFRERRRYIDEEDPYSSRRGEPEDLRGSVPSAKRPARRDSPGRVHRLQNEIEEHKATTCLIQTDISHLESNLKSAESSLQQASCGLEKLEVAAAHMKETNCILAQELHLSSKQVEATFEEIKRKHVVFCEMQDETHGKMDSELAQHKAAILQTVEREEGELHELKKEKSITDFRNAQRKAATLSENLKLGEGRISEICVAQLDAAEIQVKQLAHEKILIEGLEQEYEMACSELREECRRQCTELLQRTLKDEEQRLAAEGLQREEEIKGQIDSLNAEREENNMKILSLETLFN